MHVLIAMNISLSSEILTCGGDLYHAAKARSKVFFTFLNYLHIKSNHKTHHNSLKISKQQQHYHFSKNLKLAAIFFQKENSNRMKLLEK